MKTKTFKVVNWVQILWPSIYSSDVKNEDGIVVDRIYSNNDQGYWTRSGVDPKIYGNYSPMIESPVILNWKNL